MITDTKTVRHKTWFLGAVAGLIMPVSAWADDTIPASATADVTPPPADDAAQVGDIVVTARYRAENVQKVPIAITALSAKQLENQGVFTIKQALQQLPSLNIQGFSGRNQTITIRGIGTNAGGTNDGLEQGVGLYVDGVYRPRTGSVITDLLDIESIQLLRGPQGTLFGKNTVAGALDVRTREPEFDTYATAEFGYGSYDYTRLALLLNGKLSDTLAARVGYLRTRRDGLIYNTVYGQDWDNLDNNAVRVDLLWKPNEAFKLRLISDYSRQIGDMGFQSVAQVLPTVLADGREVRGFYRRAADVGYRPIAIDPFARRVDIDSSQYDRMPSWGVQANAEWNAGPLTVTLITAYRNWKWLPNYDGDQIGANVATQGIVITRQQQFSQELRVASQGERTIDYTGGLYFFWQEANDLQVNAYGRDASAWLATANTPTATVSTLPSAALDGLYAYAQVVPATYSYAGYGQATWNVSPVFRVTGGLRFTYEHKTGLYNAYAGGNVAPLSSFEPAIQPTVAARRAALAPNDGYQVSRNTDNLSGTLALAYDFSSDAHGYASYARGYKSPGINLVNQARGVDIFVKPETVDSFEVGLKSRFLDGAIELNLAAFWTEAGNYQANFVNTAVTPQVGYITNVGRLRSRGLEFDARAVPLKDFSLSAAGAYIDARYVRYRNAVAPYLTSYLGVVDLSGREASGQPEWSLTGAAQYRHDLGSVELTAGGDVSYRSSFYAAVNLDPFSKVDAVTLVGLNAGVRDSNGRWELSAWVRNLLDEEYFNTRSVSSTYGVVLSALGDPRLYGATLRTRF